MKTVNCSRPVALAVALTLTAMTPLQARATNAAELLAAYSAQSKAEPSVERGQAFFNRKFGRDFENCAACHGAVPVKPGKDLVSEKAIAPLAPAARAGAFADRVAVEFSFRVNCKEVVGRECSAGEKADILAWLISLKP